ncbi:WSC-domain-containing protein [Eremomyces bilateralis CBS 781.70]|uniref:WSC-domain-containing protein n=1 Tax=Eremomyces bilateralis CBS 781.70 TaxID=1392243 RepID=A0A6G1FZP6_9PEZI|nr:WSC-domain-containing protein [Eremomyces bilateralis CBS 781.70]KAF1811335.1 WSC-domain-containing protein [Eremomyces bilateralis CBS 781.70]
MARSNLKMRVAFAIAASFLSLTSANPLLLKRAGEIPDPLPEGWEYEGCYTDAQGARTLNGPYTFSATAMTIESCIAFCQTGGYVYAGTEYSGECYCGNSIANGGTLQPDSECGMTCSGDVVQACGGPNRLTTFKSDAIPPPDPVHNPGVGTWSRLGCYA